MQQVVALLRKGISYYFFPPKRYRYAVVPMIEVTKRRPILGDSNVE